MFHHRPPGTIGFTCARCGRDYPVENRVYQDGLAVCDVLPCVDREYPPSTPTPEELDTIEESRNGY